MAHLLVGQWVKVGPLGKSAEVVEQLSGGRYRVRVGDLTLICSAHDLTPTSSPKTAKRPVEHQVVKAARHSPPPSRLDLHGLTVSDAITKLASWLDRAVLADLEKVTVIHGHGTGRVQRAVHEYLSSARVVKHFRVNELNRGETEVFL